MLSKCSPKSVKLKTTILAVFHYGPWPEMITPSESGAGYSYHILSISSFFIKSINIKAITPSVKHYIMRLIKPQAISPGVPGRLALA